MARTRWGRSRRVLLPGLLIGLVGLASVGLNAGLSEPPRYDGAGYAVLGLALSTGQGYREIHTPGRAHHSHYPPGYPLALGALWRITGRSVKAAHVFSVACTLGAILGAWWWFRSMYRGPIALAAGLTLAVNWTWGRQGGAIQSEPLYFLGGQLAILAALWAARRGGIGRGMVLGVLLGACLLTRHVGAVLAMAIGLELLLRRRPASLGAAIVASAIVETIARFKGLEATAVVVLADRLCANNGELSYVAVSRARALLVVVGPVTGTKLGEALRTGRCEMVGRE